MKLSAFFPGCILLLTTGAVNGFQPILTPKSHMQTTFLQSANPLASIDYSETAQRDVWSLDQWATSYGVQKCPGFEITTDDGMDYYVVASQNIPAGTPVLYVPAELTFSAARIGEDYQQDLYSAEQDLSVSEAANLMPLFRLVVKILAEYELGDQSPWFPWLNSMPRFFNNAASMTFECFECLPPYAASLALKERGSFVNVQKALKYAPLSQSTLENKDLIKWAYNVALTRNTQLSDSCRRITPMADMFNHAAAPSVDMDWDEAGNCVCYAKYDIPAGSPLTVTLGDATNPSSLFATYGFLDSSSPGTFCKMMNLQDEMKDLNLGFKDVLFYQNGEIDPKVYDLVLYSVLKFDIDQRANFFNACMSGDEETKSAYYAEYWTFIFEALQTHVDRFIYKLDNLNAQAASKDPATHPRAPVIMQHNEFVKQTFLAVQASLQNMG